MIEIDIVQLIILALATFRWSSLLVFEEGPYFIFTRIRNLSGMTYTRISNNDELPLQPNHKQVIELARDNMLNKQYQSIDINAFSRALTCMWCTSMWVGIILWGVYALSMHFDQFTFYHIITTPFALSTAAIFMSKKILQVT